nr:probable protein phosphatase 2C 27 isoform X2 [Ipomoea batatas]
MIEMWRKSSKSDGCDEQEATGSENPPEPQFTTPNRPNKRKHLEMVEHAPEQTLGDMNFKLVLDAAHKLLGIKEHDAEGPEQSFTLCEDEFWGNPNNIAAVEELERAILRKQKIYNMPSFSLGLTQIQPAPSWVGIVNIVKDCTTNEDIGVEAPIGHQHSVIDAWCCFLSNEKEGRIGTALVGFLLLLTQRLQNSSTQWFSPTPAETEGLSSGSLIANDRDVEEAVKAILEGSYNKSSMSHAKDEFQEESDEWKQPSVKPPRHFSVEQHSISSETLLVSADLVFDGHGGMDAESFVRNNILKFITEDSYCPICLEKAMKNAFLKADYAFVDDSSVDTSCGTTALTALLCKLKLVIANAGDCGAVLGKRGRVIGLSKDHKPDSKSERHRIEKLGGVIYNGYLNGQLSVARALGDWHMKAPKGSACPLSAEPELQDIMLTDDDEFLIMGCDGLWDVMSIQCAVTTTPRGVQES